jgi:hypothetical protein
MPDKKNLEIDEIDDNDEDGGIMGNVPLDNGEIDDDFDDQFDEDGNLIEHEDDGQEEPDGEPDTEEDGEEEVPEVETVEVPVKANKQLSPMEIKLINLKKENQALATKLKQKESADNAIRLEQEQEALKAKFIEEGYDSDTAKNMSATEVRMKQLEEKTAKYDFMEENEDVFKRFPQAKADVIKIMNNSKLTGMTAEQICKGLYNDETPAYEKKNLKAVKGESEPKDTKPNLNSARQTTSNDGLTPREISEKTRLERLFNNGENLSISEYRKYAK